jgi:glycosyltransferase involved in cell wall biosynthesis
MRTLLLVRNGVSHDARVLRAARVAERTLGGGALVVGVATASAPVGRTTVEGVQVLRLSARTRGQPAHRPTQASARTASPSLSGLPRRLTLRARARRILSGASFTWQALMVARRERPRLVHANDWNTMWCGVAIKLACGARLVYDSHELWADRNGRWEQRWWLLVSEALFVRVADTVITASPGYADALASRCRVAMPAVVRNIPENLGVVVPGPPEPPSLQPPLLVYIGGLMPGRGLEQAIEALALTPAVRLRAVGPGSSEYRAGLLERARTAGVEDRLELVPAVAHSALAGVMEGATAGLCLIQPVCRSYELTLPNKLFEYAAAGLPVLASDLPVIAGIVREWGIGEVVPPADPQAITAGLTRLCAPAAWSAAAARTRAFARTHTWEQEAEGLGAIYARADSGSTTGGSTAGGSTAGGSTAGPSHATSGTTVDSPFFHSVP